MHPQIEILGASQSDLNNADMYNNCMHHCKHCTFLRCSRFVLFFWSLQLCKGKTEVTGEHLGMHTGTQQQKPQLSNCPERHIAAGATA